MSLGGGRAHTRVRHTRLHAHARTHVPCAPAGARRAGSAPGRPGAWTCRRGAPLSGGSRAPEARPQPRAALARRPAGSWGPGREPSAARRTSALTLPVSVLQTDFEKDVDLACRSGERLTGESAGGASAGPACSFYFLSCVCLSICLSSSHHCHVRPTLGPPVCAGPGRSRDSGLHPPPPAHSLRLQQGVWGLSQRSLWNTVLRLGLGRCGDVCAGAALSPGGWPPRPRPRPPRPVRPSFLHCESSRGGRGGQIFRLGRGEHQWEPRRQEDRPAVDPVASTELPGSKGEKGFNCPTKRSSRKSLFREPGAWGSGAVSL